MLSFSACWEGMGNTLPSTKVDVSIWRWTEGNEQPSTLVNATGREHYLSIWLPWEQLSRHEFIYTILGTVHIGIYTHFALVCRRMTGYGVYLHSWGGTDSDYIGRLAHTHSKPDELTEQTIFPGSFVFNVACCVVTSWVVLCREWDWLPFTVLTLLENPNIIIISHTAKLTLSLCTKSTGLIQPYLNVLMSYPHN